MRWAISYTIQRLDYKPTIVRKVAKMLVEGLRAELIESGTVSLPNLVRLEVVMDKDNLPTLIATPSKPLRTHIRKRATEGKIPWISTE